MNLSDVPLPLPPSAEPLLFSGECDAGAAGGTLPPDTAVWLEGRPH